MSFADWIRNMTDEEIAALFVAMISEAQNIMVEKFTAILKENNIDLELSLVEFPQASFADHLESLQEEREEAEEDG